MGFFRHPDKNKDPNAEDMFIKVSKSYEVGEMHSGTHSALHHNISCSTVAPADATHFLCDSQFHFLYHGLSVIITFD